MKLTRRSLLASSAALLALPKFALAQNPYVLRAEPVKSLLAEQLGETALWGFNGSSPGPVLHMKRGEEFAIDLENALDVPTSVHWHGLRIENAMDGVAHLTQMAVGAGARFSYKFTPPDAGTFWYHSHNRSYEQVERGLYGALIVEENSPPDIDHDIIVALDDWTLNLDGTLADNFDNPIKLSHDGRLGNLLKASFLQNDAPLNKGARTRLRLINFATDRVFTISISGVIGKLVALDGMPLATPRDFADIVLAPAQRADLIVDITGDELRFETTIRGNLTLLGALQTEGTRPMRKSAIRPLEANPLPAFDPAQARALILQMTGGAMSGHMGPEDLQAGNIWFLNGQSGMGDKPIYSFKRGDHAEIELINDTVFDHAIHPHGHHFLVEDTGEYRDTVLVAAGARRKILAVFDNPGKWMIHCHMLAHHEGGMGAWFEVEA